MREEDRECKECENEEVEDIDHFVIRCEHAAEERLMTGWKNGMSWVTIKMCGVVMDRVCRDEAVVRTIV